MFARHFINSLEFARNGEELNEVIPIAEMPRLRDMLAATEGDIRYRVRGLLDNEDRPMLEVTIDGVCQLLCQRCLGVLPYPVELVSRLLLVSPEELDELAQDDNELDSVPADKQLDVLGMVEEEILLSLPFAPKHPADECHSAEKGLGRPSDSPFALLAGLKKM